MRKYPIYFFVLILSIHLFGYRDAPKEVPSLKYHNVEIIASPFIVGEDLAVSKEASDAMTKLQFENKNLKSEDIDKYQKKISGPRKNRPIFIAAKDTISNIVIWTKLVYVIKYNIDLERDVQDIYITKMKIENDDILIENEANEKFKMNLITGKIKIISKGKSTPTFVPDILIDK